LFTKKPVKSRGRSNSFQLCEQSFAVTSPAKFLTSHALVARSEIICLKNHLDSIRTFQFGRLTLSTSDMKVADTDLPAFNLIASKRPLVIGHRGYPQLAPENTLPSFKLAMAAGADLVELDYHHTKDGKLIVIHDSALDRTTDAANRWSQKRIKVSSKTAAEIQSLDAGSWFDAKFAGTKIPLLAEALDTIQQGRVPLIERKGGDPSACIALLHNKNLINKVVVQAFDWEYLRQFHEQEPAQVLGALGPPTVLPNGKKAFGRSKKFSAAWIDALQKTGAKVAVWNQKLSKQTIQLAHDQSLKVWVYTVNNPTLANRLLDMGVDGLITNNTSLLWRTLALRTRSAM
jgi:glycerophosphoryl diester phosphodiesterase